MSAKKDAAIWRFTLSLPEARMWRLLEIRPSTTVHDLSLALEAALDWTSHEYAFTFRERRVSNSDSDELTSKTVESFLTLPGERFKYRHFGDEQGDWTYRVEFTEIVNQTNGRTYPALIDGAEDAPGWAFGDLDGYLHFIRAEKSGSVNEREWVEDVRGSRSDYFNEFDILGFSMALRGLREQDD